MEAAKIVIIGTDNAVSMFYGSPASKKQLILL